MSYRGVVGKVRRRRHSTRTNARDSGWFELRGYDMSNVFVFCVCVEWEIELEFEECANNQQPPTVRAAQVPLGDCDKQNNRFGGHSNLAVFVCVMMMVWSP